MKFTFLSLNSPQAQAFHTHLPTQPTLSLPPPPLPFKPTVNLTL